MMRQDLGCQPGGRYRPGCKDKTKKPVASPRPLRGNILCGSDQGHDPWPPIFTSSCLVGLCQQIHYIRAAPSTAFNGDIGYGGKILSQKKVRSVVPWRLVLLQGPG